MTVLLFGLVQHPGLDFDYRLIRIVLGLCVLCGLLPTDSGGSMLHISSSVIGAVSPTTAPC